MMHDKKVTILLAAYRGAAYVGAQIESVLKQDCGDWFLILSDDGEDTADVLDFYARSYPDRIVHHRSGRRFGSAQKHFMYLIGRFGGEAPYTMCADQDDIWHPDKVRKTLAAMEAAEADAGGPIPCLVHTDLRVVDGQLQEMDPSFMHFSKIDGTRLAFHQLLVQNVVTGCTMMINRPLAALAARGENEPAMLMHDWWIALTASALGRAVFLPEATMDYRQHGGNVVGAKNAGSLSYMKSRLKGDYARKMRDDSIAQAKAFLQCYETELSEKQKEICTAFASLPEQNRAARLRTLQKYHLWKNTLSRRAGQGLLW